MENPNVLCEGCGKRVKCRYYSGAWLCFSCKRAGKDRVSSLTLRNAT